MTECIFCRIAAGEIPSQRVDETPEVLAFRDLNPQAPSHVLLIPKRHVASSAARIAEREGLDRGWRLVTNVGAHGGQTVHHLHLHLLGGRPFQWPPG
jgi:histidine triad (HIT) family protein